MLPKALAAGSERSGTTRGRVPVTFPAFPVLLVGCPLPAFAGALTVPVVDFPVSSTAAELIGFF